MKKYTPRPKTQYNAAFTKTSPRKKTITHLLSIFFQNVPLREDSPITASWLSPPVQPMLRLYYFNVTNPQGFLERGEKPKLVEMGPYVYE